MKNGVGEGAKLPIVELGMLANAVWQIVRVPALGRARDESRQRKLCVIGLELDDRFLVKHAPDRTLKKYGKFH